MNNQGERCGEIRVARAQYFQCEIGRVDPQDGNWRFRRQEQAPCFQSEK